MSEGNTHDVLQSAGLGRAASKLIPALAGCVGGRNEISLDHPLHLLSSEENTEHQY